MAKSLNVAAIKASLANKSQTEVAAFLAELLTAATAPAPTTTPAPVTEPAKPARKPRKAKASKPATTAPTAKPAKSGNSWASYQAANNVGREVLAAAHAAGKVAQAAGKAAGYKTAFNAHLASLSKPAYYTA